jgi:hypothetical protein
MRRLLPAATLLALAPALAAAQATTTPAQAPDRGARAAATTRDPDKQVAGGASVPGWALHLDHAGAGAPKFVPMGTGYHVTAGPAAIYYDPSKVASGAYSVQASFTQTRSPMHPEAYGLFVGGKNLNSDAASYTYFIVRDDGRYAVKQRNGANDVKSLLDFVASPAVRAKDASGKATNVLRIQVAADSVRFYANDKPVIALATSATGPLNGVAGFRVNHNLDVHVDGFAVTPGAGATKAAAGR